MFWRHFILYRFYSIYLYTLVLIIILYTLVLIMYKSANFFFNATFKWRFRCFPKRNYGFFREHAQGYCLSLKEERKKKKKTWSIICYFGFKQWTSAWVKKYWILCRASFIQYSTIYLHECKSTFSVKYEKRSLNFISIKKSKHN